MVKIGEEKKGVMEKKKRKELGKKAYTSRYLHHEHIKGKEKKFPS